MLEFEVKRMLFVEALFVFVIIAFAWLLVTLVMFKKLNRTRITGVLLILLAFIAIGAVIFTLGHFLEWHETNEFCGEMCHAMEGPRVGHLISSGPQ
jgi:amino acid permease